MTPDVNVVLLNFPGPGKEMICENEDGSFTIMINAKLSYNNQLASYNHAMKHIQNNDFQKNDVQMIEAAAHTELIPKTAERIPSERFLERLKTLHAERERIQWELSGVERMAEITRSMNYGDDEDVPDYLSWHG